MSIRTALAIVASTASMILAGVAAEAASLTTLGSFDYELHGYNPQGGLVADSSGNLYGVNLNSGPNDSGTVVKYTPGAGISTLFAFDYDSGTEPFGFLHMGASNTMYGVTVNSGGGAGTLYSLTTDGDFTKLQVFTGGATGYGPYGGVISDASGALYGVTIYGGSTAFDGGTVYKYDNGIFTTLADIGSIGGRQARGGLTFDGAGNLYGTTTGGGNANQGILYKIDTNGNLSKVVDFGGALGGYPDERGGLVTGPDGNIYGTAYSNGGGTIYKLDTTTGVVSTLYDFAGSGAFYPGGRLIFDADGTIYGTTSGNYSTNYGSVFSLTQDGVMTSLYTFTDYNIGGGPQGGLYADASGALYGMASFGGGFGLGTIFKLTDTGFAVASVGGVPEPASWAMLVLGFGVVGAATRRRRALTTVTTPVAA
jgi:uncharacterized repeat protein (TIGR03803 family)